MRRPQSALSLATVCLLASTATAVGADPTLDDYLQDAQNIKNVTAIGYTLLSLKLPTDEAQGRENLAKAHWSATPDAGLTQDEAAAESKRFQAVLNDVVVTFRKYNVERLSFVGVDRLATWECQDWYYMAVTPRGPLLVVVSAEFNGRPRLFDVRTVTRWVDVKAALDHVQLKAADKVVGMTYRSPATRPAP